MPLKLLRRFQDKKLCVGEEQKVLLSRIVVLGGYETRHTKLSSSNGIFLPLLTSSLCGRVLEGGSEKFAELRYGRTKRLKSRDTRSWIARVCVERICVAKGRRKKRWKLRMTREDFSCGIGNPLGVSREIVSSYVQKLARHPCWIRFCTFFFTGNPSVESQNCQV